MIKRPVSISWSAKKDLNSTNFLKMVGDYVSNMCGKQFMAKKGLSDHNWAVHEQVESPCNVCDKIFRSKKHLAVHISKICMWFVWLSDQQKVQLWQTWTRKCDTPISAASCVVGKKTFVNKWNMERHAKKDHGLTVQGLQYSLPKRL